MNPGKFFVSLIFFTLSQIARSQSAEDIISKYIAKTGGSKKWKNVKSIISTGTYTYGGIEFLYTAWSKSPDLYKYVVTYNGKSFMQAFDGTTGWKLDEFNGDKQKTLLTGKSATAMANESDVELESPFIDYKKKGNTIQFEGRDTSDSKISYKVKLTRKSGEEETCYFDIVSYLLVRKKAHTKNAELGNSLLDIIYSGYLSVDGIEIPRKIDFRTEGQTVLSITVKQVEINKPVRKKIFKF